MSPCCLSFPAPALGVFGVSRGGCYVEGCQGAGCSLCINTQHEGAAERSLPGWGPRPSLQGSGSTSDAGHATLTGRLQAAGCRLQATQQDPGLGQRSRMDAGLRQAQEGDWLGTEVCSAHFGIGGLSEVGHLLDYTQSGCRGTAPPTSRGDRTLVTLGLPFLL